MAVVLTTLITLDPDNPVAHLADTTGLIPSARYVLAAQYLQLDTRITFTGNLDVTLTKPPVGVPADATQVSVQISPLGVAAPPPVPATYPYDYKDRLTGANLNFDFSSSPGSVPPNSAHGYSTRGKLWLDTSAVPAQLRMCAVDAVSSSSYVAGDWATLGSIIPGGDFSDRYVSIQGDSTKTGSLTLTGDVNASGDLRGANLLLSGNNIFFAGDTDATGPLFAMPAAGGGVLRIGTGNGAFSFQNHAGGEIAQLNFTNGLFIASGGIIAQGQGVTSQNAVTSHGTTCGFVFGDRGGAGPDWTWFAQSGTVAVLAASTTGNVMSVDTTGNLVMKAGGSVNADTISINTTLHAITDARVEGSLTAGPTHVTGTLAVDGTSNFTGNGQFVNDLGVTGNLQASTLAVTGNTNLASSTTVSFLHVQSDAQIDGTIGLTNSITANASGTAFSAPNGDVSAKTFKGGPAGGASLAMYNTSNHCVFRWDPAAAGNLCVRIDEALDRMLIYTPGGNINGGIQVAVDSGSASGYSVIYGVAGTNYTVNVDSVSDARLKKDIRDTEVDALSAILATPVRAFAWNTAGRDYLPHIADAPIGLIAQEVKATMPFAVGISKGGHGLPDDLHRIHYDDLVPYLMRAIQQLTARVDGFEAAMS